MDGVNHSIVILFPHRQGPCQAKVAALSNVGQYIYLMIEINGGLTVAEVGKQAHGSIAPCKRAAPGSLSEEATLKTLKKARGCTLNQMFRYILVFSQSCGLVYQLELHMVCVLCSLPHVNHAKIIIQQPAVSLASD